LDSEFKQDGKLREGQRGCLGVAQTACAALTGDVKTAER